MLSQLVTVKRACCTGTRKNMPQVEKRIIKKEEKSGKDNLIYFIILLRAGSE